MSTTITHPGSAWDEWFDEALALSILLAALCVFAVASIARTLVPGRAVRR
jgi:hypothetical protein